MDTDATLALQIDRLMRRFHSGLHPRAVRIDDEKIGPIGGMILFVIAETSPTSALAISSILGRDKAQISRVVSLLERKGMIEKSTAKADARMSELRLTDKGKLQVAAFNGALVETTRQTLGHLSPEEIQQFSNLLGKILGPNSERS